MDEPQKRKIAIITGGTRGIGKAMALAMAEAGIDLALLYLSDHSSAEETQKQGQKFGGRVNIYQCHLGNRESLGEFWRNFDNDFSHVDFFISNAATGVHRKMKDISQNSLRKVLSVNVDAFVELANESLKRMLSSSAQGPGAKGRILSISSLGSHRVIDNYGTVASSKAALEALTRQYAYEYGREGVNVNCISAGLVDTGVLNYIQGREQIIQDTIHKTPNGRLVSARDVAHLALFLLAPESSMINGQVITVDGGYSLGA